MKIFADVILVVFASVALTWAQQCPADCMASKETYAFIPADETNNQFIYIGGLFSIHSPGEDGITCSDISAQGIQNLEAFLWAITTFHQRYVNALQGVSIGAVAFDTCSSGSKITQQVLNLATCQLSYGTPIPLDPGRILSYVGPSSTEEAVQVAPLFKEIQQTLVSPSADSDILKSTQDESYVLRTVPNLFDEVYALVGIIQDMKWEYIQLVSSPTDYGSEGSSMLKSLAHMRGICIVNNQEIPTNPTNTQMENILESLKANKETNVVVVYAEAEYVRKLLSAASMKYLRGQYIWVGSSGWGTKKEAVEGLETTAEGAITVTLGSVVSNIDNFADYLNHLNESDRDPWLAEYFGSSKVKKLTDIELDVYTSYTIAAVDSLLNGIEIARKDACGSMTTELCSQFVNSDTRQALIHNAVLKSDVPLRYNITTGDPVSATYAIYNYRAPHGNMNDHSYVRVGSFDKQDSEVTLRNADLYFYDENGNRHDYNNDLAPKCLIPCKMCAQAGTSTTSEDMSTELPPDSQESTSSAFRTLRKGAWIIVLIVLAAVGLALVVLLELYFLYKLSGTAICSHWKSMWLGHLLLLAILLCYLVLFAFVHVPSEASCAIIRFGVGVTYAMCFSVLLVKLMIIFNSERVGSVQGIYQFLMFFMAWAVQLAVDIEWLVIINDSAVQDPHGNGEICSASFEDHVKTLVYVMLLIVLCNILSIQAYKIPANHHESIFIGLSAGCSIIIWLIWLLLGFLTDGTDFHEPCIAFGLWATATVILLIMFIPKVYQLSRGEGEIYEEDVPEGVPSVIHTPSLLNDLAPGSIVGSIANINHTDQVMTVTNPEAYSDILVPNGGVYTQPVSTSVPFQYDPNALYLKHPGSPSYKTQSLHSLPINRTTHYATNPRVLHVTKDLTGSHRSPSPKPHTQSELNFNVYYGPSKGVVTRNVGDPGSRARTPNKPRSLHDLGSL